MFRSIRQCLERNPAAFQPKIGKNPVEADRRHNKGKIFSNDFQKKYDKIMTKCEKC